MKGLSKKNPRGVGASKFPRIRDKIRRRIQKGTYRPGSQMPTELELSSELSVNPLTIRRALRDLVEEGLVVRRRGSGTFVAEHHLPPLIPGRHLRIGLLWPHSVSADVAQSAFEGRIRRGIMKRWQLEDVDAEFPTPGKRQPTRGIWRAPARGAEIIALGEAWDVSVRHPPIETVREGQFDGLIALGIVEEDWLAEVADLGIPLVLTDYRSIALSDRADQVYVDHLPGFQLAVDALIESGCERIHFVGEKLHLPAPDSSMTHSEWVRFRADHLRIDPDSGRRLGAMVQALARHDRLLSDSERHFTLHLDEEREALARKLLALPTDQQPDAVICNSGHQALCLKGHFAAAGRPLIAVAATDSDTPVDYWGIYSSAEELGDAAAELLLSRLKQPERKPFSVGVRTRLLRSDSHATKET